MSKGRGGLPPGVVPPKLVALLDDEIARSPRLARMTGKRKPCHEVRLAVRLAELLITSTEATDAIEHGRRRWALVRRDDP